MLLGAFAAAVAGFIILLGYEFSGARYAGVKLPAKTLALGGFTAFAIGNAIGLSMLSGGSVRYRLYARHGIGASEVAHMTVFASLALGTALPPLAALATLSNLPAASTYLHLQRVEVQFQQQVSAGDQGDCKQQQGNGQPDGLPVFAQQIQPTQTSGSDRLFCCDGVLCFSLTHRPING